MRPTITRLLLLAVALSLGCGQDRSARDGDGSVSTKGPVDTLADIIRLDQPLSGAPVRSPLVVRGEARGYYFFEADFPVRLEMADGSVLGTAPATAQGPWMTEDWVPFAATLEFVAPSGGRAYLILERANPSGMPENAQVLRVPVSVSGP